MFDIEYATSPKSRKVWTNMGRSSAAYIIKDLVSKSGSIHITVSGKTRYFVTYDRFNQEFDVCKHGNNYGSTYYGRSYKTLSGALNKLEKLAESEVLI